MGNKIKSSSKSKIAPLTPICFQDVLADILPDFPTDIIAVLVELVIDPEAFAFVGRYFNKHSLQIISIPPDTVPILHWTYFDHLALCSKRLLDASFTSFPIVLQWKFKAVVHHGSPVFFEVRNARNKEIILLPIGTQTQSGHTIVQLRIKKASNKEFTVDSYIFSTNDSAHSGGIQFTLSELESAVLCLWASGAGQLIQIDQFCASVFY